MVTRCHNFTADFHMSTRIGTCYSSCEPGQLSDQLTSGRSVGQMEFDSLVMPTFEQMKHIDGVLVRRFTVYIDFFDCHFEIKLPSHP